MKPTYAKATKGIVGILLFLAILIAANALIASFRVRKDITHEGLYTLSEGTRGLLAAIPRTVTLKFYYSRSAEGLPPPMKQYAQQILDLLQEYERVSAGKVVLEIIDPKPDTDEEERAQKSGIERMNIDPLGSSNFYLGLVATAGTKEQTISYFDVRQESRVEYQVTRLISEVTSAKKPRIGILSSLPVMGMNAGMAMFGGPQAGSEPWAFVEELGYAYELVEVPTAASEIPAEISTLLVIHPKELPPASLFALDQFVLRGGHMIAFVDPASITEQMSQPRQMGMMMGSQGSDLNRLTASWGVSSRDGMVISDPTCATALTVSRNRREEVPSFLTIGPKLMSTQELATAALEMVMLPYATAFTGKPTEGLTLTPLITASKSAGFVDAMTVMMGPQGRSPAPTPVPETLYLALRLEGKFKTAFPEGRPADPQGGASTNAAPVLKEAQKPGVVVLVGDSDMLYDRFALDRSPFGQLMEINNNLSFVNNLLDQLSGSPALIGLRSRGSFRKPFTRVDALREKAYAGAREEEEKLTKSIQEAEQQLRQLRAQVTENGEQRLILSPAQQEAIKKYTQEEARFRRELRELRKNLNNEIDTLGIKIKAVNIALMPAVVALFGVVYGLRRRARAAQG